MDWGVGRRGRGRRMTDSRHAPEEVVKNTPENCFGHSSYYNGTYTFTVFIEYNQARGEETEWQEHRTTITTRRKEGEKKWMHL